MKNYLYIPVLFVILLGCDGNSKTDNGQLTVTNNTDMTITVYYLSELDNGYYQGTRTEARETQVSSGSSRQVYVDTVFWDADVEVEYNGHMKTYDLDFDLSGRESLSVETGHFPSPIVANG